MGKDVVLCVSINTQPYPYILLPPPPFASLRLCAKLPKIQKGKKHETKALIGNRWGRFYWF